MDFTGFAVVSEDERVRLSFRSVDFLSSFSLEAMAIIEALRFFISTDVERATIFSDSRAVLMAIGGKFVPGRADMDSGT